MPGEGNIFGVAELMDKEDNKRERATATRRFVLRVDRTIAPIINNSG
jgi:hypothetical protein